MRISLEGLCLVAMGVIIVVIVTLCCSCTMFEKKESSNEMEELTQDVLKKNEGVDIQVRPIPNERGK